jgi:hypothetical protein
LTVCGDEEFTDVYVLTAKLPPDVGRINAGLKIHPEVSGVEIYVPLSGVGGGGVVEPETVSTLQGVTGTEVLHRFPSCR